MASSKQETYHIEEYKALREQLQTTLKDRLDFNRWGLIGLAGLYSYIFSNPKSILFSVPIIFSLIVIAHLIQEHRNVVWIANYISNDLERWLAEPRVPVTNGAPVSGGPGGWETQLGRPGTVAKSPLLWWPLPAWYGIFFGTVIAWIIFLGCPSIL